jgi:hypothetical protein
VDVVGATQGQAGSCSRGPGDGGSRDHWKDLDRYLYFFSSLFMNLVVLDAGNLYKVVLGFLKHCQVYHCE